MSIRHVGIVSVGAALTIALPLAAQVPDSARERQRSSAIGVEEALRYRNLLQLSDQQITRLQALRRERVEARATRMREMLELRSRLDAGDLTHEEFRRQLRARRDAMPGQTAQRGDPVADLLTDQQRLRVAELRRETMRRRGWQGRGVGPRMGPRFRLPGRGGPRRAPVRRWPGRGG